MQKLISELKKAGLWTTLTITIMFLFMACVRTSPDSDNIIFITMPYSDPSLNPEPTTEAVRTIRSAISRLAGDPNLSGHPVNKFLNDPDLQVRIIFDNPGTVDGAMVTNRNEIHINSQRDFAYYLVTLAHEFIHLEIMEKYGNPANFSFLPPEDYAFLNLMEEAFSNSLGSWVQLMYPEVPGNYDIHTWRIQTDYTNRTEAIRNDFLSANPEYNLEQAIDEIIAELFNAFMTRTGVYTAIEIPRNMAIVYGRRNTFLIPEYEIYSEKSDALLRHVWDYLVSMMPFKLPEYLSFDHYREQFMLNLIEWAGAALNPEDSILYWINFNAEGAARERLAAVSESERVYDYLPIEDEERLNRIIKELTLAPIHAYAQTSEFDYDPGESSITIFTEESAARLFLDEWGLHDLMQHDVYLIDNEMNVDFWFSEAADVYQVDSARNFSIRNFLLRQPYTMGRTPYDRLARNLRISWETTSFRIFLGGELIYHDRYDENLNPVR